MDESAISSVRAHHLPAQWDMTRMSLTPISDAIPTCYYPGIEGVNNYSPADARTTTSSMYETPSRNHSPESLLSVSSSDSRQKYSEQLQRTSSHVALGTNAVPYNQASSSEEVTSLRERVRQLEHVIDRLRGYHSTRFRAGWEARTDARKKIYCSLNRAGNALCAWHDSRRERRVYPPRNAPPGYLNCGCTYEQALFEESLSRHGVGSYHPGEAVRMDPALRNPLLDLLERRYGYKDGDFELEPINETWLGGQSPEDWQHKAREGRATKTKNWNSLVYVYSIQTHRNSSIINCRYSKAFSFASSDIYCYY